MDGSEVKDLKKLEVEIVDSVKRAFKKPISNRQEKDLKDLADNIAGVSVILPDEIINEESVLADLVNLGYLATIEDSEDDRVLTVYKRFEDTIKD